MLAVSTLSFILLSFYDFSSASSSNAIYSTNEYDDATHSAKSGEDYEFCVEWNKTYNSDNFISVKICHCILFPHFQRHEINVVYVKSLSSILGKLHSLPTYILIKYIVTCNLRNV